MEATEVQDIGIPDPADVLILEAEALNRNATLDEVWMKRGVTYCVISYSDVFTPPETILYAYRGIEEQQTLFGAAVQRVVLEEVDDDRAA